MRIELSDPSVNRTVWAFYNGDESPLYISSCKADCEGYEDTLYTEEVLSVHDPDKAISILVSLVQSDSELKAQVSSYLVNNMCWGTRAWLSRQAKVLL